MTALAALDRKLLRDLWRLRAQALAVAMVIACGVALLVMALTTIDALEETTEAYYERYRFAQVFASVKRAPEHLTAEAAAIPGVRSVESRVAHRATLDLAGFPEPVTAQVLSLPDWGEAKLNRVVLRAGRQPAPGRGDEALVSEPFAEAQNLKPGDRFDAILNGRKQSLKIVGVALSPEFIYAIAPGGLMPDDERFAVVWMGRKALEAAFDMEGAFNDLSLTLLPGTRPQEVVDRLDILLAPYGGIGAYERADHPSHWFLDNEITQQKNMAGILPGIFLAVAAFLTNMVMGRLIATERGEIGLLKAFGYSHVSVALHYAKMVLLIAGLGVLIGFLIGSLLGQYNTRLYGEFYRFPFLLYRPGGESYAVAGLVSLGAALAGSLGAVLRAAALPPAEAMRPPAPPSFHRTWISGSRVALLLDEPSRMIFRRIIRWPGKAFFSATGIALSLAVLLLSLQWLDSIDRIIEEQFFRAQRQDATLALVEIAPERVKQDLKTLPGVLAVETFRSVAARVSNGHLSRRQAVIGLEEDARLSPIYDVRRGRLEPPPDGVLISTKLAEVLKIAPGQRLKVEILEGRRPVIEPLVVGTFETYVDTPLYMRRAVLNRLLQEGRVVNAAQLAVDERDRGAFLAALKEVPAVTAVSFRRATVTIFRDTMGETVLIFVGFFIAFSCTLAFGVIYNSVRIALSERARELATLRVLGFSRLEISYILLGEIGILTVLALPLGVAFGVALAWYLAEAFETELFRVPLTIEDPTIGVSALVILATAAVSAALVRRRLDRLDLIAVLKTRE